MLKNTETLATDDQKQSTLQKTSLIKFNKQKSDKLNMDELINYDPPKLAQTKDSTKKEQIGIDEGENSIKVNKYIRLDLKSVDMLVDNPNKFKKFVANYSEDLELRKLYESEHGENSPFKSQDQITENPSSKFIKATTLKHSETISTKNEEEVVKNVVFAIDKNNPSRKSIMPIKIESETNLQNLENPSNNVFKKQQSILMNSKGLTARSTNTLTSSNFARLPTAPTEKFLNRGINATSSDQDFRKTSSTFRLTTSRSFHKKGANALGLRLDHPRLVN